MKDLIETLEEYANGFTNVIAPPEEDVKELLKHIYNQEQEIERLNQDIKTLLKENGNKEKVIIKQDNIINELEKWLENINKLYKDTRISYVEAISDTLDKLQELKGDGSNGN